MRLDFHPNFVEQAVFAATRGDARLECELHARVDHLYEISDHERRQCSFRQAYGDLFAHWKMSKVVADALGEFPLIEHRINQCVTVPAARGKSQVVDLFVKQPEAGPTGIVRTLLLQLCPESLQRADQLRPWLRCELMLVCDMLDDEFGYLPDAFAGSIWDHNNQRDRYQVLWRIYVVARLARAGRAHLSELTTLKSAFVRAFSHHGIVPSADDFSRIVERQRLTHGQLMNWAIQPEQVLNAQSSLVSQAVSKRLGEVCALCGFPTYDWYAFDLDVGAEIAAAIERAVPTWQSDSGACRQCVETYASALGREFVN